MWGHVRAAAITTTLLFPFVGLRPADADWLPNGNPIGIMFPAPAIDGSFPRAAEDGSGGAFVAWEGTDYPPLWLSHLTASGEPAAEWPPAGLSLHPYPWIGFPLFAISDRAGGVFVINDASECTAHCGAWSGVLLVQHVESDGSLAVGWTSDGVQISEEGYEWDHFFQGGRHTAAASDDRGGFIAVWSRELLPRNKDGSTSHDLHAQRVSASGALLWGESGIVVRSATPIHRFSQAVAPDGEGGAFVFWVDERSPTIFGQHISASGIPLWSIDGVPIVRAQFTVNGRLSALPDGSHGSIVAWAGSSTAGTGLFATRVNRGGELPWRTETQVLDVDPVQSDFRVVPDEKGGAILGWRDTREIGGETIRAQRISHAGKVLWMKEGAPVATVPSHKNYLALAADDGEGAYFAWADSRSAGEVYATHLAGTGETVTGWAHDGSPLCAQLADVFSVDLERDAAGGALIVWSDGRNQSNLCLATKLSPDGPVSPPSLRTSSAADRVGKPAWRESLATSPERASLEIRPIFGSRGGLVRFVLPYASSGTLELFDVTGRKLWGREIGNLSAGEHQLRLEDEVWFPPGVYLVRLVQDNHAATARIAIVR